MEEARIDLEKEHTHTFLDELKDFIIELWYMLKQDYIKFETIYLQ